MSTGPINPVLPPPPQQPPIGESPQKRASRTWLWILIGGGAFFLFVAALFTLIFLSVKHGQRTEVAGGSPFGEKIGVIELEGVILDSELFMKQLKKFDEDDSIKAIIIKINSPGGGAAASQEMYQAVRRVRDRKKKPIVSAISTVGASGAYYVAAGTDKIFANSASIVGSVGVIAEWVNYGDLLHWAKLKDVTRKAGELKDAGSPTRDMTPKEREYLQALIDDMHAQFIHDVAQGRNVKDEQLKPIANGQVWTGQQSMALPVKLIDKIGSFQDAVDETAKRVGIKGEPTLVKPEKERRSLYDILFNDASDLIPDRAKMLENHPGFYYIWR
jgi:protease IV